MPRAYYNEIDPYAADWLRNLIAAGHIAPGDVDERSIEDVTPDDLHGYTQCHFFAGIGVWSYALRRAGWPDNRPVWTGSCPCQPFSAAGQGTGFADERHLWPAWFHLLESNSPPVVFGEQVASRDGLTWLDLVLADLEGAGYSGGAVDLCAAGVGAPHIRQRLYFVADAAGEGWRPERTDGHAADGIETVRGGEEESRRRGAACGVADTHGAGTARLGGDGGESETAAGVRRGFTDCGESGRLGHPHHQGSQAREREALERTGRREEGRAALQSGGAPGWLDDSQRQRRDAMRYGDNGKHDGQLSGAAREGSAKPGPTNGRWADVDWLFCRDGKWRPVEPGTFPLAHGAPARVGRLRAYGNAINAEQAAAVIGAYMYLRGLDLV